MEPVTFILVFKTSNNCLPNAWRGLFLTFLNVPFYLNTFFRKILLYKKEELVVEAKHLLFDTRSMSDKITCFTVLQRKNVSFINMMKTLIEKVLYWLVLRFYCK